MSAALKGAPDTWYKQPADVVSVGGGGDDANFYLPGTQPGASTNCTYYGRHRSRPRPAPTPDHPRPRRRRQPTPAPAIPQPVACCRPDAHSPPDATGALAH